MIEQWKPVEHYRNGYYYEVSNHGRVRNTETGKTLKGCTNKNGQRQVTLKIDGKVRSFAIHTLVTSAFIGLRPSGYVVEHIDGDAYNNRVDNLRYIPRRIAETRGKRERDCSSYYPGVCWDRSRRMWVAHITHNKKQHFLGRFDDEEEAAAAYQNALKKILGKY